MSLLRWLEYERLESLKLSGRVLDFGGGELASYRSKLGTWGREFQYDSANIDPAMKPTYLVDDSGLIPVDCGKYDMVFSVNTLEHVYHLEKTLRELRRVLKPGGRLVLIIPFIFRVHGHPNDYYRGTPSFWETALTAAGLTEIGIEALTWGPFSTGQAVSHTPGPFKGARGAIGLFADTGHAAQHWSGSGVLRVEQDDPRVNSPLGYFIECWTPEGR